MHWIVDHASTIAAWAMPAALLVLIVCEAWRPRRQRSLPRLPRWWQQFALQALSDALIQWSVPIAAFALALIAERHAWGLLHALTMPPLCAVALSVMLLDLCSYGLHWIEHRIPVLWRFHQVHHSDLEFDCSTALRHHPIEALYSQVVFGLMIVVCGIAPLGLLIFAALSRVHDLFSHSNVALPASLDRLLRVLIVTPDMHRVHHSSDVAEGNSNYSAMFPWWDRLFGTYQRAPALGHDAMEVGLMSHRRPDELALWPLLCLPFKPVARPIPVMN